MDYSNTDVNALVGELEPRGEMSIRGPIVLKGYFRNKSKTEEGLDKDGFYHTGDVAKILKGGRIKIIDRAENIFKLTIGEYMAPEKLENIYIKSDFVSQIYIYGVSLKDYIAAIIAPDNEYI
jgi:long-chain acyl-CoA synthetase